MQEMAENGKVTGKQEKAIIELLNLTNKSVLGVANKLGMGERTIHRWLKQPQFQKALGESRNKLREDALERLKESVITAVECLTGLLSGKEIIRLKASQLIIDYTLKLRETEDFDERLKKLEKILYEQIRK